MAERDRPGAVVRRARRSSLLNIIGLRDTARADPTHRWPEALRKADLVDVSQGRIRFGIPSCYLKEVRAAFDADVFFKRVVPSGALRTRMSLGAEAIGRPKALDKSKTALAQRMHGSGESASTIASTLGVSRATVYRVLAGDAE